VRSCWSRARPTGASLPHRGIIAAHGIPRGIAVPRAFGARGPGPVPCSRGAPVSALLLFPVVLSLLVLGAHFLRSGNLLLLLVVVVLLGLLAVRRRWAARTVQVALVLGAAEWVRTMVVLAAFRVQVGQPFRSVSSASLERCTPSIDAEEATVVVIQNFRSSGSFRKGLSVKGVVSSWAYYTTFSFCAWYLHRISGGMTTKNIFCSRGRT